MKSFPHAVLGRWPALHCPRPGGPTPPLAAVELVPSAINKLRWVARPTQSQFLPLWDSVTWGMAV